MDSTPLQQQQQHLDMGFVPVAHIQNAAGAPLQQPLHSKTDELHGGQAHAEQQEEQLLQHGRQQHTGSQVDQDHRGGDGRNEQSLMARRIMLEEEKRHLMFMQASQQRTAMMMPPSQYGIPSQGFAMAPAQAMQLQAMNARFMVPQGFNAMPMNAPMYFQAPAGGQQTPSTLQPGHIMMPQMMMAHPQMMMGSNTTMMMPMQGQYDPTMGQFFPQAMPQPTHTDNPDTNKNTDEEGRRSPSPEMPIRPLSAYNFFFCDEREQVLHQESGEEAPEEDPDEKKKRLLGQHIHKDRTKRRPHRKTHGTIGFTSLSKLIGKRWRALPEEKKQFFRDIAAMDMDRYQKSVAEYNNERLSKRGKR